MPVTSAADLATFRRHAAARLILKCLHDQRDALEMLARECSGDLREALDELANGIGDAMADAGVERMIAREVYDTDEDARDREVEARDRRILSSAQESGR